MAEITHWLVEDKDGESFACGAETHGVSGIHKLNSPSLFDVDCKRCLAASRKNPSLVGASHDA